MRDINRRSLTPEDRAVVEQVERDTRVSANLDGVYEAITTGNIAAARGHSQRYGQNSGTNNESGGLPMDMQGVFLASSNILGEQGMNNAINNAFPSTDQYANYGQGQRRGRNVYADTGYYEDSREPRRPAVSRNQFQAINKYGAIVEFLGTPQGDKIASRILQEMNSLVVDQIEKNSQTVHPDAKMCVAKKQNLNQFFQGEGWVCQVTANGGWLGTEAIYYHQASDKAFVLRKYGAKFVDVSAEFNIVHDCQIVHEDVDSIEHLEIIE